MARLAPECKCRERIGKQPKVGFYRCNVGLLDFTIRTGTISFERSHIPLHKWLYAMYLLGTARKGISSLQLAKEIGVTQKVRMVYAATFARGVWLNDKDINKLRGIVEADECYIGGKEPISTNTRNSGLGGSVCSLVSSKPRPKRQAPEAERSVCEA